MNTLMIVTTTSLQIVSNATNSFLVVRQIESANTLIYANKKFPNFSVYELKV